jgi:hypothetical protein
VVRSFGFSRFAELMMSDKPTGEIIWRLTYQVNATGPEQRPEPVLLILADKEGWLHMAKQFTQIAELKAGDPQTDPDNHHHLGYSDPPVNGKLSHHMELRCGMLTPENRKAALGKYEIQEAPAADHDMRTLFATLIASASEEIQDG